ncbi:ABC transporter ATP-binding protein [Actinomadura viridis]|uniref:NitT/TauT family transport system ATP-binding protein n=1 Tax=Actinomadura viridis TaxID=58110 RepID=A0A931DKN5_9ACTN|nr:ABC transporter ATP-binding protein [Actinomadura viridis]MBG6092969.1 NitT/TauT family transport system ATP-binding protein [Actinomadura viridis]
MSALLEVGGLAAGFGTAPDVLAGVDLTVERGEFVSVLGPSGCGKSTILNCTAGLLVPRAGRVVFDGRPVEGVNTGVGYMTQDDTLLPWRRIADNVALPLRMRRVPKGEIGPLVERYLTLLDLRDAAQLYPAQLSGGMKRRALLARSMIYEPELLLMDEPFAALDAQLRAQMHAELRRTVRETGVTVLFVTHDIGEAVALSDRVVVVGGPRPSGIVHEQAIPFGTDREMETLRFHPDFAALERDLHAALQSARPPKGDPR